MQETAKVNLSSMEKGSKKGKAKSSGKAQQVVASVAAMENPPDWMEKVGKFHYLQTFVGDEVKAGIRRGNPVKQWMQSAGTVP